MKIKIPYRPPSVNTYWKRGRNTTYISKQGREFKENVHEYIKFVEGIRKVKYTGDIKVKLTLNFKDKRKRDIDNYNKAILDSLNKIIWLDDSQIQEMNIIKNTGTGQHDNFIIEITESPCK